MNTTDSGHDNASSSASGNRLFPDGEKAVDWLQKCLLVFINGCAIVFAVAGVGISGFCLWAGVGLLMSNLVMAVVNLFLFAPVGIYLIFTFCKLWTEINKRNIKHFCNVFFGISALTICGNSPMLTGASHPVVDLLFFFGFIIALYFIRKFTIKGLCRIFFEYGMPAERAEVVESSVPDFE